MTIGMWATLGLVLMRRQTSKPSMPGIITSKSTMSGNSAATRVSACSPLDAVKTSKYSAVSFASSSLTLERMSSTTRTRAVITVCPDSAEEPAHCVQEAGHGNRLGDVGFAAALPDDLFIALHGEGGHRDDRNRAQGVVLFEPFGHLEPRDFRKLDVHQDEVRVML